MNIPCLAINSGNDPIVLPEFVPQERLNENQNIISLMVGGGGHVEYCSGIKARFWCVDIAIQFFKSCRWKREGILLSTVRRNSM
jgi:predicted alpha/beta-fold hydrolase